MKRIALGVLALVGAFVFLSTQHVQSHPHPDPITPNGIYARDQAGRIVGCGLDGDLCHWSKPVVVEPEDN